MSDEEFLLLYIFPDFAGHLPVSYPILQKALRFPVGIFHRNFLRKGRGFSGFCLKGNSFCLCQKDRLGFAIYRKQFFQKRNRNIQAVFLIRKT